VKRFVFINPVRQSGECLPAPVRPIQCRKDKKRGKYEKQDFVQRHSDGCFTCMGR